MGENETTKSQEAISNDPMPEMIESTQTRPRWLATYAHPITGARESCYTGGYSHAMAALKHIDEIKILTKGQVSHTGIIQYMGKDPVNANGFGPYINHMLLTQYGITKGLQLFNSEGIDAVLKNLIRCKHLSALNRSTPHK